MEDENGLREMTKVERDARRLLQQEGIPKGSTKMAEKRGAGTSGGDIGKLDTNLHGLIMRDKKFVYRYDVTVKGTTYNGKEVEMTKRVSGDAEIIRRRETCATIFRLVKEQRGDFFQEKQWAVYYDQQAILFSRGRLCVDEGTGTRELNVDQNIPAALRFRSVAVLIKRVEEKLLLTEFFNGGDAVQNLSLEQFLNVASIIFHSDRPIISNVAVRSEWKVEKLHSQRLWLSSLAYLSKSELDKYRGVCRWANWLIGQHIGGKLKQRREMHSLIIGPDPFIDPDLPMTPLDINRWMEDEDDEEMEEMEAKAKQLAGVIVYPYEPEDITVRISIRPVSEERQQFYLDVTNRLENGDALLIARLLPRITPPTTVFKHVFLMFDHTPELPADATYGELYFNPALFSLPSNEDGSGGGQTKLNTHYLTILSPLQRDSSREMIQNMELIVQCKELYRMYRPFAFSSFLRLVALARPLNASAWIDAKDEDMEDGRLDEMVNFFTQIVPGFELSVPHLRVTIRNTATWPKFLPKMNATNPREEQLAERRYKFQLYNYGSGEKLEVTVRGSFGNIEDEAKGEAGLRVSEMALHFRLDSDRKG